jgi:ubiquinone/menaquinone biosynthesis C-methylase UbiE
MKDVFSGLQKMDVPYVLDAATGRGEFINILKKNLRSYTQIIGVDNSDKSVNYAQKLFPENDVEIYRMDLEDLQFEDGYFGLVCMSNSLHHMRDPRKVLSELMRVLAPGGMFLLTEMYRDGEQSDPQHTHIMMHHWLASVDRRLGICHAETYTRQEIISMMDKLKLTAKHVEDYYFPTDNPKEARNCENLRNNLMDTFKRLESIPDGESLIQEGQLLIQRIKDIGCASPSRLLITGIKAKK